MRDDWLPLIAVMGLMAAAVILLLGETSNNTLAAESAPFRDKVGFKFIGPGVHAEKKVQLCATAPSGEIRAKIKFHPKHGEVSRQFSGHSADEGGLELAAKTGCMYYTAPPLQGKRMRFDQIELTVEGERVAKLNLPIYPQKPEPASSSLIS